MSLEDDLLEQRVKRTAEIEALGFRAYGQRFDFTHTVPQILATESAKTAEELAAAKPQVRIAGRIQTIRRMGKAGFLHLMQSGERLQVYVRKDAVSERDFALYQLLDLGDIIGVEGYLVPHPHRRVERARREAHVPLQDPADHARRSGTASKTSRSATASAIWI